MGRTGSFLILYKLQESQEMWNKHKSVRKGWAWEKGRRLTDGRLRRQKLRCVLCLGFSDRNCDASLV